MPTKKTNVRKLTQALKEAIEDSIQEATAQLDADLKNGSPVDSGRFRASWFHVNGSTQAGNAVAPEPDEGQKVPAPPNLQPGEVNPKQDQVIYNALPYATRLALSGYSKKVPEDWFNVIADRWERGAYLDEAMRKNGLK
jgi:hypothetical protein